MKTEIKIVVRAYPVEIMDERTGERRQDTVVLDKERIRAASLIGMDDQDIIYRLYNRKGFFVLSVGTPHKKEIAVDLQDLYFQGTPVEADP